MPNFSKLSLFEWRLTPRRRAYRRCLFVWKYATSSGNTVGCWRLLPFSSFASSVHVVFQAKLLYGTENLWIPDSNNQVYGCLCWLGCNNLFAETELTVLHTKMLSRNHFAQFALLQSIFLLGRKLSFIIIYRQIWTNINDRRGAAHLRYNFNAFLYAKFEPS